MNFLGLPVSELDPARFLALGKGLYAAVYLAGIPWLRTGVWGISVVGLALIFLQLV